MGTKLLERMLTISRSAGGGDLEGSFLPGRPPQVGGAVIAPPHPLYGGSMDSPVASELAWACASAGIPSLRFNWRGVGASAGEATGDAAAADEDYAAALAHQKESVAGPLVACGYSFGACAAARAGSRELRVRRLVLVAPPPSLLDRAALAAFAGRALVVVGAGDRIAPPRELEAIASDAQVRLHVIAEADHFFGAGLAELGRIAREWLGGT
ncbi:MAG TPA: alpha/beta family hydrolase [Myxococcota bacterium]|nr:alpha/beta family hydrolase [Myxococcota bacterium]